MKKHTKRGTESTFDRLMQNPDWKESFEKGYEHFLISEMMIEIKMENSKQKTTDLD